MSPTKTASGKTARTKKRKTKTAPRKSSLKKLVIVESPSKASTIKKYLGTGYDVKASVGHIIDLPKSRIGVNLENFKPDYIVMRDKYKILKELRESAKKSSEIILASDPDREGEAIAWHLKNDLEANVLSKIAERAVPIKRVKFTEITEKEIKEQIGKPSEIDIRLVDAQQGRRVIDRIFGYQLSPLLWKKVKSKLSAGRVQSVALRLICEREKEIDSFAPEEYWIISVLFKKDKSRFSAELSRIDGRKPIIGSSSEADRIEEEINQGESRISDIRKKTVSRNPYPPLITSTLQQSANNIFGFPSIKTMLIAQQLYEGIDMGSRRNGLITYMRTDSTRISPIAISQVRDYIKDNFGEKYLPQKPNYYSNRKSSQDAHEAVRPSNVEHHPDKVHEYLTAEQYKIYSLIWKRFVSSQMAPAVYEQLSIDVENGNKLFSAGESKVIFEGFQKVNDLSRSEKEKELPHDLSSGDSLEISNIKKSQKFTEPPPRYTDASLVKVMEENGIGRPSTYAPTIFTLTKRYYVKKEGRSLYPTVLGKAVNKLLVENFPELINNNFTASMEEELDDVEEGAKEWKNVVSDFYGAFQPVLSKAYENIDSIKGSFDQQTDYSCEICGRKMVKKLGKYGIFLACSGWPDCRNAKPLPYGKCPKCGEGLIVQKKGRRTRAFYGCTKYPACDFVSYYKPAEEESGNNLAQDADLLYSRKKKKV